MQSNKVCLSAIKAEYSEMPNSEKKLADYIFKNYDKIAEMSTTVLSKNAGIAKSVIVRFCRRLGFSGYTDFRLALSREQARNEQLNFTPYIEKDDSEIKILDKIFSADIKTLHDTATSIERADFKKAVDILYNAKSIYIYGIGTSAGIVCDFQYRLMQLGFNAFCFTDLANMKVSTLNITKNDAAIGISNSGRTVATIESLLLAKKNGAKTICLTSYPNSEIISASDCPLIVKTDEIQYPMEAISSRIAHIAVLDAIAVSIFAKDYDNTVERSAKARDLIDTVRY